MTLADRVRVAMAFGFPVGAILHFVWLFQNGSMMFHGPAPEWATWFWFIVCGVDVVVCAALLMRPRLGLRLAFATMAVVMYVNWTQFPTFEYGFNYVLVGLTVFALFVFATAPWLWTVSKWRLGG
jgi:hypothetical protein